MSRHEKILPAKNSGRSLLYIVALFFPAFLLVFLLALLPPAHGDAVISVTPTRIPLTITAGEKAVAEVTLTNRGEQEMRLLPQVLAVTEGEGSTINFVVEEDCAWVTFEKNELMLRPLMEQQVDVTVAPPADADPGLRRLALTFIQAPEGAGEIGVTGGLAVLLELDVLPTENAVSSSFPIWLPALSATVFLLAIGALLTLQRHRRRSSGGEALADDGGRSRE